MKPVPEHLGKRNMEIRWNWQLQSNAVLEVPDHGHSGTATWDMETWGKRLDDPAKRNSVLIIPEREQADIGYFFCRGTEGLGGRSKRLLKGTIGKKKRKKQGLEKEGNITLSWSYTVCSHGDQPVNIPAWNQLEVWPSGHLGCKGAKGKPSGRQRSSHVRTGTRWNKKGPGVVL